MCSQSDRNSLQFRQVPNAFLASSRYPLILDLRRDATASSCGQTIHFAAARGKKSAGLDFTGLWIGWWSSVLSQLWHHLESTASHQAASAERRRLRPVTPSSERHAPCVSMRSVHPFGQRYFRVCGHIQSKVNRGCFWCSWSWTFWGQANKGSLIHPILQALSITQISSQLKISKLTSRAHRTLQIGLRSQPQARFSILCSTCHRPWPGSWAGKWQMAVRPVKHWDRAPLCYKVCLLRKYGLRPESLPLHALHVYVYIYIYVDKYIIYI